jgi:hypothetical protein
MGRAQPNLEPLECRFGSRLGRMTVQKCRDRIPFDSGFGVPDLYFGTVFSTGRIVVPSKPDRNEPRGNKMLICIGLRENQNETLGTSRVV